MKETETIATSVEDSDGVYFVPSFSGLQVCLCVSVIFYLINFHCCLYRLVFCMYMSTLFLTHGSSHGFVMFVFVPQAPLNDPKACASFMGLKPSTTKRHLVRAILESIAFRWAEQSCLQDLTVLSKDLSMIKEYDLLKLWEDRRDWLCQGQKLTRAW